MAQLPDFRSYTLIRHKLVKTDSEIHTDLSIAFPEACPGFSTIKRWTTDIQRGTFSLEKRTSSGRPRETRTEDTIARVRELVTKNPRFSTRQIAAESSLAQATVSRLLKQDLGLKIVLSCWVPHSLSDQNKKDRVKCSRELLKLFCHLGERFLGSHLLVQDESWFLWDSIERREVWVSPNGKRYCTPRPKLTKRKTMLLVAFTCKPKRFSVSVLPQGTTATHETMIEFLKATGRRFSDLKKAKIQLKDLYLMWDNAPSHNAINSRQYLDQRKVERVKQSPYSPDINLCDRNLFRKLKTMLRDEDFNGPEEVEAAVRRAMKRIPEEELFEQLIKLRAHLNDVIGAEGDYVF